MLWIRCSEPLRRVKQEAEDVESVFTQTLPRQNILRSTENQETRGEMSEGPTQCNSHTVWFDVVWR